MMDEQTSSTVLTPEDLEALDFLKCVAERSVQNMAGDTTAIGELARFKRAIEALDRILVDALAAELRDADALNR